MKSSNPVKIAKQFANYGAAQDDPAAAAMADQTGQEHASALNDVGWNVWSGDFTQWMSHLNASSNSIGHWRIGAPSDSEMGYGRFGRSWKRVVGRSQPGLQMKLDQTMWHGTMPDAVWARIASYQTTTNHSTSGVACWALEYQHSNTGERISIPGTVQKGGGTWVTDLLELRNLAAGAMLSLGVAPEIRSEAMPCDVIFHSIEILRDKP